MPGRQTELTTALNGMIAKGPRFALSVPEVTLPTVAGALPDAMQELARTYIGARQRAGDSILEACRALAAARDTANHGEWGIFLEAIGLEESRARAQIRIYEEAQRNPAFAEHIRTGFLSEAVARELLPLPADARQALMDQPTPPTRAEIRDAKRVPAPVLPPADIAARARSLGLTVATLPSGDITIDDGRNVHQAPDAESAVIILDALASGLTKRVTEVRARIEALQGTLDPTADSSGRYAVIPPPFVPDTTIRKPLAELVRIVDAWERTAAADVTVTPIPIRDEYTTPIDERRRTSQYRERLKYAYLDDDEQAEGIAALALGCHLLGIPRDQFETALADVLDDETYELLIGVLQ